MPKPVEIDFDVNAADAEREIEKLDESLRSQGVAVDDLQRLYNEMQLASNKTAEASQRLADAQAALAANTDPDKQRELKGEVLAAQVALDKQGQEVLELTQEYQGLKAGTDEVTEANKQAGLTITDFNSALSLAKQAYAAIEAAIKAVIVPTIELAKQQRELSRTTGLSVEESGRLIQASDDVQVSYASLSGALEFAIRSNKLQGTSVGELADQYLALPPGIERSKFAMDTFGRSGADLNPLLALGSKGIKELGDNAERTGLVMSQQSVDAAREYEKALDDLEDSTLALKVQIAEGLIPTLTELFSGLSKWIGVQNQLDRATKDGVISEEEHQAILVALKGGMMDVAEATAYLTNKTEAYTTVMSAGRGITREFSSEAKESIGATSELAGSLDDAGKAAHGAADGFRQAGGAIKDTTDYASILAAGLSGTIQKAQQDYYNVIAETTPEIAKLTAQIQKYQAANGQSVTVTEDATTSAAEYELAQIKAAVAAQKLAEYTGDSREEMLTLQVAADNAQAKVVSLGEGFGFTQEYTLDYTKKIQEANGTLGELETKQAAAESALKRTTAEFIFQKLAAGLTDEALLKVATSLGLIDPASAAAAQATLDMKKHWEETKGSADGLAQGAKDIADAIAALTDKHVTITVDTIRNERINQITTSYIDNTYGTGGPGYTPPGKAGGGPVTAGMPYWVGEHGPEVMVPDQNGTVIPNDKVGKRMGTTVIQNIYTTAPVSETSLLQTARAVAESWS